MKLLMLLTVLAQAQAGPCYDGVIGEGPRARRAIVELHRADSATLHLQTRPARAVALVRAAEGSLATGDGAVSVQVENDVAHVRTAGVESVLQRTTARLDARLAGEWSTAVGPGGMIRLVMRLTAGPCGLPVGELDSPDQGQSQLPLTAVRPERDSLVLEASYLGLRVRVASSGADSSRAGSFEQGGAAMPVTLRRSVALRRPQEPVRPFPYEERDVPFASRAPEITLAGTLTVPSGGGPHPAVVLVSGSGTQDRDETVAGHKPFLVLADHFTRLGYAVLRYDDRGAGASGPALNPLAQDLDDAADDVRGALAYLRTLPEIDAARIGLAGHSEGGYVVGIVAAADPGIAFLMLLAAPAASGREVLLAQRAALTRASGVAEPVVHVDSMLIARIFDELADAAASSAEIATRVDAALASWRATLAPDQRAVVDSLLGSRTPAQDSASLALWQSRWFARLLRHEPAPALQAIRVPVLAVLGGLDLQVPAWQSAARLAALFAGERRELLTVVEARGVNHMLQPARTGSMDEYLTIDETIAPELLAAMADWLVRVSPPAKR